MTDSILEEQETDYTLDINHDGTVTITDICKTIAIRQKRDKSEKHKITLQFEQNRVSVSNTFNIPIEIIQLSSPTEIKLVVNSQPELMIELSGCCEDGRLIVDADTTYTLCLSGIKLKSSHAPVFYSTSKSVLNVEITANTANTLEDDKDYTMESSELIPNGCFHSEGSIYFTGRGHLLVNGNNKHAIYSKKSIEIDGCDIAVEKASSDAIHAGKHVSIYNAHLNLNGMGQDGIDSDRYIKVINSSIKATINADAAKGIKCAEDLIIEKSKIQMSATGSIKNKKGDISYCTLLKADGNISLLASDIGLAHIGRGGKCISCNGDMSIAEGEYSMIMSGDGDEYVNDTGESDYYTPKCIAVDGTLRIESGKIICQSSGLGGKGIVAGNYLYIGKNNTDGPTIDISTSGMSILDDESEDERNGCPKAIKCSGIVYIDSGEITCTTYHSGGEGIESLRSIKINGGTITCNTFDDGINATDGITVNGGSIYCNSVNNDGLDSNGTITINGGIIKAISQHRFNECLDAEHQQIQINGGTIFGISGSPIYIGETIQPYFSQGVTEMWDGVISCSLKAGATYKLIAPMGKSQMEIISPFTTTKACFFISAPYLIENREYTIKEYDNGNITDVVTFEPTYEIINRY